MNRNYFLVFFLVGAVFFLNYPSPEQPVAVVFDSLSLSNTQDLSQILTDAGYKVTSYVAREANVSNFKKIPAESDLVIFRVHSSIHQGKVCLFTGELYSHEKHSVDQLINSVHMARTNSTGDYYFAVSSNFFREYTPELDGATILNLGCDAATSNDLAKVFLEKGASSFTSWNGPVSLEHTDIVFCDIVSSIAEGKDVGTAVQNAIDKHGSDPYFNSSLICFK